MEQLQIKKIVTFSQLHSFKESLGDNTRRQFDQFEHCDLQDMISDPDRFNWFAMVDWSPDEIGAYGFLQKSARKSKTLTLGIVVNDLFQHKGWGRHICQLMIDWAWAHGYNKIWLGCYEDNLPALKLYKSLGFEMEGIFVDDLDDGRSIYSLAIFNGAPKTYERLKLHEKWVTLEHH